MKITSFLLIILVLSNVVRPIYAQEIMTPTPTVTLISTPPPETSPTPEQQTGTASASAVIENDVNFQVVGEHIDKEVVNITNDSNDTIEVIPEDNLPRNKEVETQNDTQSEVKFENEAHVENTVDIAANTGNVNTSDSADIVTGNATSDVAIVNLVNTNLVGSCGFFGIVNIFASQEGDIILPNEEQYLDKENCNFSLASETNNTSDTNNSAEVVNTVSAETDTGENKASVVTTGSSQTDVNVLDTLNTNFTGDNWVYIRITDFGNWNGQIIGARGDLSQEDGSYIVRYNVPDSNSSLADNGSSIKNQAVIQNTVTATATTGGNEGAGNESSVKTGDAKVHVDIANIANTNVIGNNWYFALISNFSSFQGNIIIPRPNVSIQQSQDIGEIEEGGEVTVRINYSNNGSYPAKNTIITLTFPTSFSISETGGGVVTGNSLIWNMDTLPSGATGAVVAKFKLIQKADARNFPFVSSITTSSYEPVITDNTSSVVLGFKEKSASNDVASDRSVEEQVSVIQSPLTRFYITPAVQHVQTNKLATSIRPKSEVKGITIKKELPIESSVCAFGLLGCRNIFLSLISTLLFGGIILLRRQRKKVN